MRQKVLVIVGPTASGKSALAVELARRFNGEIISADSRQIYRGLDIGTGKITKREMNGVPHHLLDIISPKKAFSAGDFAKRAKSAIRDISVRGRLPIIVGGTGFYIDALLGILPPPNVPPDAKLRAKLQKMTTSKLYALLQKKDSRRAKQMASPSERNNKIRLIRALEIVHALGKVPPPNKKSAYDALWIGIAPPMKVLEKKIAIRLFARIRAGIVSEARRLHGGGLSYKRMEELGLEYRSLARLLRKEISKQEMETELLRDIRRYAKKQVAYWRRNKDIHWVLSSSKLSDITTRINKWSR